ncbi:claudin-1 [Ciona intestinalis]
MGSAAIEVTSLILFTIGTILGVVSVAIPYWKKNDPEDTIRDSIVRHEGLWIKCQTFNTGNWDCDDFNRFFLGLPTELQAARGFGITSIVFGILAIIAMILGMDSLPCGGDVKGLKKRVRLIGGSIGFLSGLLLIAAVSWYANDIRIAHEFASQQLLLNSSTTITRYIFGEALFIGWIAGALLILAGILAMCTGCGGESYDDAPRNYVYRPPKSAGNSQEYV